MAEAASGGWLAVDPEVGGRLFVALRDGRLFRSLDGAEELTQVEGITVGSEGAVWTDPDDPDLLLLVSGRVFTSADGGASFTEISDAIDGPARRIGEVERSRSTRVAGAHSGRWRFGRG